MTSGKRVIYWKATSPSLPTVASRSGSRRATLSPFPLACHAHGRFTRPCENITGLDDDRTEHESPVGQVGTDHRPTQPATAGNDHFAKETASRRVRRGR